jgi:hypothetical protein
VHSPSFAAPKNIEEELFFEHFARENWPSGTSAIAAEVEIGEHAAGYSTFEFCNVVSGCRPRH